MLLGSVQMGLAPAGDHPARRVLRPTRCADMLPVVRTPASLQGIVCADREVSHTLSQTTVTVPEHDDPGDWYADKDFTEIIAETQRHTKAAMNTVAERMLTMHEKDMERLAHRLKDEFSRRVDTLLDKIEKLERERAMLEAAVVRAGAESSARYSTIREEDGQEKEEEYEEEVEDYTGCWSESSADE